MSVLHDLPLMIPVSLILLAFVALNLKYQAELQFIIALRLRWQQVHFIHDHSIVPMFILHVRAAYHCFLKLPLIPK